MKRLAVVVALVALVASCPAQNFSQSRHRRRAAAPVESAVVNIFQIDFRDYTLALNGRSFRLIDGFYAETVATGGQWGLELVDGAQYGDLTGDRREEAVFVLRYGPVGAPDMAEARVYTLESGRPVLLATFPVTESVNCELINYVNIDNGTVLIERVVGNGARCEHNEIAQYRWNGRSFMQVGETRRIPCRCI